MQFWQLGKAPVLKEFEGLLASRVWYRKRSRWAWVRGVREWVKGLEEKLR